jgi:hypothetical protein
MSAALKSTGILLLIMCCALAAGCTQASRDKRQARALADRATEMGATLTSAGAPFAEQINKWLAGETIDIAALKSALAAIEPLPAKFHAEFEKMPYPENQYAVSSYRTSVLNYLEGQKKLVGSLQEMTEEAALQNPADEERRKKVALEFRSLAEAQQKTNKDVRIKAERLTSYLRE